MAQDQVKRQSSFYLLTKRRFLPLFITQFLGAFNDNLYKMAMLTLIIYRLAAEQNMNEAMLSNLAAGLFMLPYFLASAFAGQLADKFEKSIQIRFIKLWEVGLMIFGAIGFFSGNIYLMMGMLFGMGLQSTFFGPIKYAILPEHLTKDELLAGNSLIEAGTFLSILLGMLLGPPLVMAENGLMLAAAGTIGAAVVGLIASLFIPKTQQAAPDLKLRKNIIAETRTQYKDIRRDKVIFLSVIGISWFWMFGSVFMAQISPLVKSSLFMAESGISLMLGLFTIGIGFGSLLCNWLLSGKISASYQRFSLFGISLSGLMIYLCLMAYPSFDVLAARFPDLLLTGENGESLLAVSAFMQTLQGQGLMLSIVALSVSGGIFIVPLYARLQSQSDADKCSRTIAANNVMNSLFMVCGAVAAMGLLSLHASVNEVIVIVSLTSLVMIFIMRPLSQGISQK